MNLALTQPSLTEEFVVTEVNRVVRFMSAWKDLRTQQQDHKNEEDPPYVTVEIPSDAPATCSVCNRNNAIYTRAAQMVYVCPIFDERSVGWYACRECIEFMERTTKPNEKIIIAYLHKKGAHVPHSSSWWKKRFRTASSRSMLEKSGSDASGNNTFRM